MRGALRIGKLFGIDLAVDWSWSLVFLLVSWNLTVVFQTWHPSWTAGVSFLLAVSAALVFFASVIAHELGHALVAKSFGMKVREIRLFLFGGVSDIEREPPSPRAEFWMAIAGPLVSFALGIGFVLLAGLSLPSVDPTNPLETLAEAGPLATLFLWLGPINLIVGAFNLIPGFPLDGGRILRALIWKVTGDLHKATVAASTVGRAVGWTFIVMGIAMVFGAKLPIFGQGPVGGMWLAFIGWFLTQAAERSMSALLVQEVLDGVRVEHLMRRILPLERDAVPADTTVHAAVNKWFMHSSERAFPVIDADDGRLLGLVCVADVRKVAPGEWGHTPVSDIMTTRDRLTVTTPSDDAQEALRKLAKLDVDQLPVLDGETLVGMLSRSDVARWLELHVGGPRLGTPRMA